MRRIGVREIKIRLGRTRPPATPNAAPAATGSNPCAAAWPSPAAPPRALEKFQPRIAGRLSLATNSACNPRHIPSSGLPARNRFAAAASAVSRFPSVRINCPKCPTPGRISTSRIANRLPESPRAPSPCPAAPARAPPTADFPRRIRPAKSSQQPLRARQHALQLRVARRRKPQRARKRLEHRLHLMVRRASVDQSQMHVGGGRLRESPKEILHQFGLQVADARAPKISTGTRNAPAR